MFAKKAPVKTSNLHQAKQHVVNHIIIDTEGTDVATPEFRMQDEKTKEIFLRHVQLELAEKFIYVTSKFNQKTQWSIRKLINQLSYKPQKKISESNRLIVVHNLMDVTSQDLYEKRKTEVANCYWEPDVPIEESFRPMLREISIQDKSVIYNYYQTTETIHLFLVRHPAQPSKDDWCYIHNLACIEVIKQLLLTTNPRKFNLLNEFIFHANNLFKRYTYIRGWNETYAIKHFPEEKKIRPVRYKPQNVENFGESSQEEFSDNQKVEEVELSGMQITDVGEVITEGKSKLNGNVFSNTDYRIIIIHAPGISDLSSINFTFNGWLALTITVRLPNLVADEDKISGKDPDFARTELNTGTAIFHHSFLENEPFRRPTSRAELDKMCSLQHGILTVRLPRESENVIVK